MNYSTPRTIPRWVGAALAAGAIVNVTAEAIVAAAGDTPPYSYVNDYVNFLGSPFAGTTSGPGAHRLRPRAPHTRHS